MKKIPTVEEILHYRQFGGAKKVNSTTGEVEFDYSLESNAKLREMTLRIMQVPMKDEVKAIAWKFCKTLVNYSHCPVSKPEYKRMKKYTEEHELVDVILTALNKYLPTNENCILSRFDTIGYYYSLALISQSNYRRKDCLSLLCEKVDYEIDNLDNKGALLLRNMQALFKEYPDLTEFTTKLKAV